MNSEDDDFEMVVDLPIKVESDQIKMEATSTDNSFRLVVDVVGPFSLRQKEIMKTFHFSKIKTTEGTQTRAKRIISWKLSKISCAKTQC